MEKNYYDILGIPFDATEHDIARAWRQKAKDLHPDRGGDPQAFREASEAHETLRNEISRRLYDSILLSQQESAQTGGYYEQPEPEPAGARTQYDGYAYQAPRPDGRTGPYEDPYFSYEDGYGNTGASNPQQPYGQQPPYPYWNNPSFNHSTFNPRRLRNPGRWPKKFSITALVLIVGGILWFAIGYYFAEPPTSVGGVAANGHKVLILFALIYAIHTSLLLSGYGVKYNRFMMYPWMLFCSFTTFFPAAPHLNIEQHGMVVFTITPFLLVTIGVEVARFANSRTI